MMFFLQTDLSQTLAAWAQVGLALASLILAIFVAFQTVRIKELSEIVSELQKQTGAMNQTLIIEKMMTIKERMPFFIRTDLPVNDPRKRRVCLKNIGLTCTHLRIHGQSENDVEFELPQVKTINNGSSFEIILKFPGDILKPVDFYLQFGSHFGIKHFQHIFYATNKDITVERPMDDLYY